MEGGPHWVPHVSLLRHGTILHISKSKCGAHTRLVARVLKQTGRTMKLGSPCLVCDTVERYCFLCPGWMGVRSNVDGEVTNPSVSVLRKATMSASSLLVKPRLPIWVVTVAGFSGGGQQVTFSPFEPCAQRGSFCEVL